MAELTFRDFAAAIMRGDLAAAAEVLGVLLDLPAERAKDAAAHFQGQMANPAFMAKAMSLRTAVTSGTDAEITALLESCFGLAGDEHRAALAALRRRASVERY